MLTFQLGPKLKINKNLAFFFEIFISNFSFHLTAYVTWTIYFSANFSIYSGAKMSRTLAFFGGKP